MRPWALLLVIGCAAEPGADSAVDDRDDDGLGSNDACAVSPLTVEVGGGESSFRPLTDGADVVIVHGPQGGWHVDVAGVVGHARQTVAVRPRLVLEADGTQLAGDQQDEYVALADYDVGACTGRFWGRRAFVDDVQGTDQAFICELEGAVATLSVEVRDPQDERLATDEIRVVLRVDPVDAAHNCP